MESMCHARRARSAREGHLFDEKRHSIFSQGKGREKTETCRHSSEQGYWWSDAGDRYLGFRRASGNGRFGICRAHEAQLQMISIARSPPQNLLSRRLKKISTL